MAKAKTTVKKDAPISEQAPEQLAELLATKQAELVGYRRGLVIGELANPSAIKTTKKEIARIKTALSSKEGDK